MSRVKLVLTLLVLIFAVSSMSAYNLYVNAAANPLNANGSPQHPYKKIQHAVNHILNDPVFHNYDNPSQWATINVAPSETGYMRTS